MYVGLNAAKMQSDKPKPDRSTALPVLATVREAYRVFFANLGLWFRLVGVPTAMLFTVGGFTQLFGATGNLSVYFILMGFLGLYYCSQIPMATAWHRLILRAEDAGSHSYLMEGREALYLLNLILIGVVCVVLFLLGGYILGQVLLVPMMQGLSDDIASGRGSGGVEVFLIATGIVLFSLQVAIAYLVGPVLLTLPAAAIGNSIGIRETYRKIGDNRGRLVGLYILAYLPIKLLNQVLRWVFGEPGFLLFIPALLFAPVIIGVLSITYRELVQKPEAASGTPTQT